DGDTSQNRDIPVPQEVKQRFEKMKKDGFFKRDGTC
ncbi:RHS repeat-associated core domain-containing protein, partial [Escherichia fergusonii]|nr:RHS repeat-associated core domain-containing protein [Escherichia fergusonii]